MSATFDATTTSEYIAATTAEDRSALIVAALTGTISVKVFNGSNVEMGSGTMAAPWAEASGAVVTVGEVSSFTVGTTATPDANWYIRFQNSGVTRWVRGSFGLSGSGQNFTWSLATWEAAQTGTIGEATITTTGNEAPVFTAAPATADIGSSGGTIQFTATDPEGAPITYSLTTTRNGITINATTGLVTVTSAAASSVGNIVVRAFDGVLATTATCNVTVASPIDPGVTGVGSDAVYVGAWRSTEDTVTGWDWMLPSSVEGAAIGGVYTNGNSAFPANWKGNRVRNVNATWKVLEPSDGTYNFSSITSALNDANYDGVILNVRGWVVNIVDTGGANIHLSEWSAPTWLQSPNYQEALRTGKRVRNLVISNSTIKAQHIALINALGSSGILTHQKLWGMILHTPSSSRGEEAGAWQGDEAATKAAVGDIITAWTNAMGVNAKKLMWTDDMNQWPDLWATAVTDGGTGARGGSIEGWLKHQYTPGYTHLSQQIVDSNGYLTVDEDGLILSQGRGWLDENEYYNRGNNDTDNPTKQQQFRMGNLRTLQMRRQFNWVDDGYQMNPQMCAWENVLQGHSASTTPEAWCCLMRTWTRSRTTDSSTYVNREINNLEFFLTQREATGATTTPVIQKNHGGDMSNNPSLPATLHYMNIARTGTNIEFSLDSRFISGARSVAIKVVWYDSSSEAWSLVYNKSTGGTATKTVAAHTPTNIARTRTFFCSDFTGSSAIDFRLTSGGNTPFMFVRVIKV